MSDDESEPIDDRDAQEERLAKAYERGEITKHDPELSQLRSAVKLDWLMQDSHARISARGYNELKQFQLSSEKQRAKRCEEARRHNEKMNNLVFDPHMRPCLQRLINLDLLCEMGAALCTGKEAAGKPSLAT
jgi:hypothetical protein